MGNLDLAAPVPVFPLAECVQLPHTTLPLHIFEPRYRAMTRDAIQGRRMIAMAVFADEQWRRDYDGAPPIRPVVCLGYIAQHAGLPDGRFNLLLQGLDRARIVEEPPHSPYRVAHLELLEDKGYDIDVAAERDRIETMLDDEAIAKLAAVRAINHWRSREIPTTVLVDAIASALLEDTASRYAMLAECSLVARARTVTATIESLIGRTRAEQSHGPPRDGDGRCMN